MPRLAAQVEPPNADDLVQRGRCAIATSRWNADLPYMLDAAVESPESQAAPDGQATDDLLSQLAGKEIDRLLSDAGVEPSATPSTGASPTADPSTGSLSTSTLPATTDSASPRVDAADHSDVVAKDSSNTGALGATAAVMIAADPAGASGGSANSALVTNELDQIVARQLAEAVLGAATSGNAAAAEQNNAVATAAPAGVEADGVSGLLDRLEAGERAEPPTAAPAAEAKPPEPAPVVESAPAVAVAPSDEAAPAEDPMEIQVPAGDAPEPTLVGRVLDWVTLPLDPFPAPMRDLIGKIAIVTTLNAAAVLIYVTFFRK